MSGKSSTGIEMKINRYLSHAFIISLILVTGCNQENPPRPEPVQITGTYSHDGLNLTYPDHWRPEYDESPDIYASRGERPAPKT